MNYKKWLTPEKIILGASYVLVQLFVGTYTMIIDNVLNGVTESVFVTQQGIIRYALPAVMFVITHVIFVKARKKHKLFIKMIPDSKKNVYSETKIFAWFLAIFSVLMILLILIALLFV